MSIDATNWAWSLQKLTPAEKIVLLSFADRAGESMEAWPSKKRLELDTCLSHNTVDKVLKSLQQKGHIMKTGEERKQVPVYRLIGVPTREDRYKELSTTPPNSSKNISTTPPNIGPPTPPNSGVPTPPNSGVQNHQLNPKRNLISKNISFSSLLEFKDFVLKLIIETGKAEAEVLVEQVLYYANKFKNKRNEIESVNIAIPLIQKGLWKIPHGYKGITSKSIREEEEKKEIQKQQRITEDAQIGRIINKAVKTGSRQSLAEMLKEFAQSKNGGDLCTG